MKRIILLLVTTLAIGIISCDKTVKTKKRRSTEIKNKNLININLQVSVKEILIKLSKNSKNIIFNRALALADEKQKNSKNHYLDIFVEEFDKIADGTKLNNASIFSNLVLPNGVTTTNNELLKEILQKKVDQYIKSTKEVLRIRIDKFGVDYPKIQRVGNSNKIQIELRGVKDTLRIRKLIENRGNLQFWETYNAIEMYDFLTKAAEKSVDFFKENHKVDDKKNNNKKSTPNEGLSTYFSMNLSSQSPIIGHVRVKDTALINTFLNNKSIKALLPNKTKYVKFLWDYKSISKKLSKREIKMGTKNPELIALYAMKSNWRNSPSIEGDIISDANQDLDSQGYNPDRPIVNMTMNATATRAWAKMTEQNQGKCIAVVLDNEVYTAPNVGTVITSGSTIISGGSMTINEAKDIATVLTTDQLPTSVKIIKLSYQKN